MIKSVLFDLDGVLLDTESIYTDFWSGIDRRFPTGVANFAYVIKGNTLTNILNTYFPAPEVQAEIRRLLVEQELNMVYRPFDGALELMEQLRRRGITTAIVTSSNAAKMKHIFAGLPRLGQLIDTLVTDEDVTASKPDPQGYLLAAKRLGARGCECVVVEDSLAGLEAGVRAGARVLGIATTNPREAVEKLASHTINAIGDITADELISI